MNTREGLETNLLEKNLWNSPNLSVQDKNNHGIVWRTKELPAEPIILLHSSSTRE
jgi:hypothetical protein